MLGADSVSLAVDLATKQGFRPDVYVVDLAGLALAPTDLQRLQFLRGNSPLLLIESGQYTNPEAASLRAARVTRRPVTLGEIATTAIKMVHR